MARGNAVLNWFRKCTPCFTSEEQDRMSISGDSRTPRTNRRSENTGLSRGEGDVASSSRGGGDVASSSRGGGDVASSSNTVKHGTESCTRELNLDRTSSTPLLGDSMTPGTTSWNIEVERFNRSGGSSTPPPRTPRSKNTGSSSKGKSILSEKTNDNFRAWNYFNFGQHRSDQYSWARVKARTCDFPCINIDVRLVRSGMFVGLFDGHGSTNTCSLYQLANMFNNAIAAANPTTENPTLEDPENVLIQAFIRTDEEWLAFVRRHFHSNQLLAASGTSALVGLIGGSYVNLAHVGDSKAVISTVDETDSISAIELTKDDNVNDPVVREELQGEHPNDPDFITRDSEGVYRIKGRSELSKSLGDAYLKLPTTCKIDKYPEYHLNSPVGSQRYLSAEPRTVKSFIEGKHQCIIFANDELWKILTPTEVVLIVHFNPRPGIAATVIRHALKRVADGNNMTYEELQKVASEPKDNPFYKEIAVIIVFFAKESVRSTSTETVFFDSLNEELQIDEGQLPQTDEDDERH